MTEFLKLSDEIFRTKTDEYSFPLFSYLHFKIILYLILISLIIFIFRNKIRKWKYKRIFEISLSCVLFLTQIFLALWYSRFPNLCLNESLPLYPCRISIIMSGIALIYKKNETAKSITYFWGIIGAIGAFSFPITNSYIFPHITYYSFYIGHYSLMIAGLYFIFVDKFRPTFHNVKCALIFSFIFVICAFIANSIFDSNYAFLNPPNGYKILKYMHINNVVTTSLLAYFIFILGIFVMYLPFAIKNYKKYNLFEISLIKK